MERKVLSLDCKKLPISFEGVEYELSPLKLKHQAIADKLDSEDSKEVLNSIYELLEAAGLPKEVSAELSMSASQELISELVNLSAKKN